MNCPFGGNGRLHAARAPPANNKETLTVLIRTPPGDELHRFYIKVKAAAYSKTTGNIRRP